MGDASKAYNVHCRTDGFLLEGLERAEFMGVPCVRGVHRLWRESEWAPRAVMYIPLSEITHIYEFDSLAAALDEHRRWESARPKPPLLSLRRWVR